MDTTVLADEPTEATDTPPTWSELIASRLADVTRFGTRTRPRPRFAEAKASDPDAVALNAADETSIGISDVAGDRAEEPGGSEASTVERGGRSRSEPLDLDYWWLLVAPLAGAIALSSASVLLDSNPFRTGTSPSGLLAFAVLIPFFLLCVAGTLALFRDAILLRAAGAGWSPNPWRYVVPSAVALTAVRSYPVVRAVGRAEGLVGFLAGTFVVALATASILAGPAYLYRRRTRVARS